MKYLISNIRILTTDAERKLFVEQVERLVKKLKIVPEHFVEAEKLKINISRINSYELRISCSLKLKNSLVFLTESGKDFRVVSSVLFDKFRKKLASQLDRNRVWYSKTKKKIREESFENYYEDLETFRDSLDETSFKSLVKVLLPGLERYVIRMLTSAQSADLLNMGDQTPDDIIDEVILRTFQTFEQNKDSAEDMNIWMMKETDIVLNELIDSSKHRKHAASIEDLTNSELAGLEEKYMFDSSGAPIMMEDLDEYEQTETMLGIEEAYLISGGEKETIDKISDKLSRKQMKELIRNELVNLPLRHQSVYDLFFFEQTDVEDIAMIKNESSERIEEIIEEVKLYLTQRLKI